LLVGIGGPILTAMFTVDEGSAEAIRQALEQGGELSAVAELRRRFPLITDNTEARRCVRIIAGWRPLPKAKPAGGRRQPGQRKD
jgi:hypothetical protein